MEKIVGAAQLYFMPHPLLEIVQRLMAHPVDCWPMINIPKGDYCILKIAELSKPSESF